MIDLFSMTRRCISKLEKFVSDRVWNEPYSEYRTNTRPRILNKVSAVLSVADTAGVGKTLVEYTPAAGVLLGSFDPISLPATGSAYYVYTIEKGQFSSFEVNQYEWITLQDFCNNQVVNAKTGEVGHSLLDLRVCSDDGKFLNRGYIYIKQDPHGEGMLLAVDADMFARSVDSKNCGPAEIIFTKYFDSDFVNDDKIVCRRLTNEDISRINSERLNPVPNTAIIAFANGAVLAGQYLDKLSTGDYLEYIEENPMYADTIAVVRTGRDEHNYSFRSDGHVSPRILIHVPIIKNQQNHLISIYTCDVCLILKDKNGLDSFGVVLNQAGREINFHQLTHNDFSIDRDLADRVAALHGATDYSIHVYVRHHNKKKLGIVHDANYCDLLYTYRHDDEDILDMLLQRGTVANKYNLSFWSAVHLEKNSMYARMMVQRTGPIIPCETGYYRTPIEMYPIIGKTYYRLDKTSSVTKVEVTGGVILPDDVYEYTSESTPAETEFSVDSKKMCLEFVKHTGCLQTKDNQCDNCGIFDVCGDGSGDKTGGRRVGIAGGKYKEAICPEFSTKGLKDYIGILGYYNTLQLVCKRVTTYYVRGVKTSVADNLKGGDTSQEAVLPTIDYNKIPVQVPLVLTDLPYNAFDAIVYLNGDKLPEGAVSIVGETFTQPLGFVEKHFTYSPSKAEDSFLREDARKLIVQIDEEKCVIRPGDYVTVEVIVKPDGDTSAQSSKSVVFDMADNGSEDDTSSEPHQYALDPIGQSYQVERRKSEMIFLNGKTLIPGLDYFPFSGYTEAVDYKPIVQNMSYLTRKGNVLEYVTTDDEVVNLHHGFVLGKFITWSDVADSWFDNLSVLTADGKVCQKFEFSRDGFKISQDGLENGEAYFVRTQLPSCVLDLFNYEDERLGDYAKLDKLSKYFAYLNKAKPQLKRAVIAGSHKVYSTYLLKIIKDYVHGDFDFEIKPDKDEFLAQFSAYENLKTSDVTMNGMITEDDRLYVDIFPVYRNLEVPNRMMRRKISYMIAMMLPSDVIRHREHINND